MSDAFTLSLFTFSLLGAFSTSFPICFASLLLLSTSPPFDSSKSMSNTAFKKSGSAKSADNCFRKLAAPSRSAWLVFSTAFLCPMSDHNPVFRSFSKNLPGGSNDLTASTIDRDIDIFCRFVLETYNSLFKLTRLRKLSFPGCRLVVTPLPHRTSWWCGFSMSSIFCSSTSNRRFEVSMVGKSIRVDDAL